MPAPRSWWDFYRGYCYWRIQPERRIIVGVVWGLLLFGAGVACAHSRFVRVGKPQVSLRTILFAMGAACLLLAEGLNRWPQLFALPVLTAAMLGYSECIKRLVKWTRQWNTEP
jgi:hypothetical protein